MNDTQSVQWLIKEFGLPFAMLIVFVVGLMRKWWVIGWMYLEKDVENKELKSADKERRAQAEKLLEMLARERQ